MGSLDAVVKEYLKGTKVVADIANFKLFGGEQRIHPEQLQEMDTAVLTVPYGTDQAALPAQKFRDKLMAVVDDCRDVRLVRLVLGDEAEAKTQYAEPVKLLYYDSAQYADQVTRAGASRRQEREEQKLMALNKAAAAEDSAGEPSEEVAVLAEDPAGEPSEEVAVLAEDPAGEPSEEVATVAEDSAGVASEEVAAAAEDFVEGDAKGSSGRKEHPTSGEFLGNFHKTDRLVPVITIVLHLSPERWDGPRALREMFGEVDEALLRFVPDYHINLISPADLAEEDFNMLRTDLREVLMFIKYSKDKTKLRELKAKKIFRNVSQPALDVINKATNSKIPYVVDEEGECDMCEGLKGMLEDERAEERARGDARMQNMMVSAIKNVTEAFQISSEQAMQILKVPEAEISKYRALL